MVRGGAEGIIRRYVYFSATISVKNVTRAIKIARHIRQTFVIKNIAIIKVSEALSFRREAPKKVKMSLRGDIY